MAGLEIKSLFSPEETLVFAAKGHADFVSLGGGQVLQSVHEPGWRWSEHVKPIAGTDSCQATHLAYVISGRIHVRMDDGTEGELAPGDICSIASGHDAWTIGDEPCVLVDFGRIEGYAKRG
jgi:hypothetical protein